MRKQVNMVWLGLMLIAVGAAAQNPTVTTDGSTQTGYIPYFKSSATQVSDSPISVSGSNVGIGTTAPGALLQVGSTYSQNPSIMVGGQDSNNTSTGSYSLLFGAFRDVESIVSGIVATPTWTCCGGYPASGYPGIRLNTLSFYPSYDVANPAAYSPSMQINAYGNVGIATTSQNRKLEVGNGIPSVVDTTYINIAALYAMAAADSSGRAIFLNMSDIPFSGEAELGAYNYSGSAFIPLHLNGSKIILGDSSRGNGNVGIGTTSPGYKLDVAGQIHSSSGGIVFPDGSVQMTAFDPVGSGNGTISQSNGNVGVGTATPGATPPSGYVAGTPILEVNGDIVLTNGNGGSITFQDGTTQSTAWTGALGGGDYAESVELSGDRTKYEPGDLLVVDKHAPSNFVKSSEPYSTMVAGIYSTKPGVVGRRQTSPKSADEIPMAVVGIVPAKVSAENGAIEAGDLLVSSSTPGVAMKGTDRNRMLGAVVGKAMGTLDAGTGTIEVLVSLQ